MSHRETKYYRRYDELRDRDPDASYDDLMRQAKADVNASEDAVDAVNLRILHESELWPLVEAIQAAMTEAYRIEHDKDQTVAEMELNKDQSRRAVSTAFHAYSQAREDLFEQKVRDAGLSFCTRCKRLKPTEDVELTAVKARVMHSDSDCSYNSWSWMEDHLDIHMMCGQCRDQAVQPPEEVSSDGSSGTTYSMLVPAKLEDGRYLVRQGGQWEELPKNGRNLVTSRRDYRDDLYFDFGLPLELKIFMGKLYMSESWRDSILVFDVASSAVTA